MSSFEAGLFLLFFLVFSAASRFQVADACDVQSDGVLGAGVPMTTNEIALRVLPLPAWSRPIAMGTAVLFFLSWIFPVVAGLSSNTDSFPRWWGRLDVALALVLVILAFVIMRISQGKVDKQAEKASYRAYRILLHGILIMCVVFFLSGDRITWINCLTGFAWRTWLLLYALPAWLIATRKISAPQVRD